MPSDVDKVWLQDLCEETGAVDRIIGEWNACALAELDCVPHSEHRTVLQQLPCMYVHTLVQNLRTSRAAE